MNNRWCNPGHITAKDCICSPDIELLAVGLHPYYLPCEFSHAIVVAVYIPPSANPTSAWDVIHSIVAGLQTTHPSALIIISGDFNDVSIKKTLPKFTQYVTCKTREEKTLDLLYARKLERKLQQNNTREVWSGMRTIPGLRPTSSGTDG